MKNSLSAALGLLLALTLVAPLQGQVVLDPNAPSLSGSTVIDFSEFAHGSYASLTSGAVTIGSDAPLRISSQYSGYYGTTGTQLDNSQGSGSWLSFTFADALSAFGFVHGAADNIWDLFIYDGGNNLLGHVAVDPTHNSPTGGFVGWEDTQGRIRSARLVDRRDLYASDYVLYDDFEYVTAAGAVAVPEPVSLLLLGTGLIGVAGVARRRRSATQV